MMHNAACQAQTTLGFFTLLWCAVTVFMATSDLLSPRTTSSIVEVDNVQVSGVRPHDYSQRKKGEYAIVKFSLQADLASLFTWNTKQVFVYVTAEWPSGQNDTNEAVIWDRIITAPSTDYLSEMSAVAQRRLRKKTRDRTMGQDSRGIITLHNQRAKYHVTSPSGKMGATGDVRLKMHFNVQPWVGFLTWNQERDLGLWHAMDGGESNPFDIPPVKYSDRNGTWTSQGVYS